MNIQDALKKTGKACDPANRGSYYVEEDKGGVLYWYMIDGTKETAVSLEYIHASWWQPYHEVEEIRPENAGELWQFNNLFVWCTVQKNEVLEMICAQGKDIETIDKMNLTTHNKNGWTRLFPPIEDGSVERREFNDINALSFYDGDTIKGNELPNGKRAKMILIIPKDKQYE